MHACGFCVVLYPFINPSAVGTSREKIEEFIFAIAASHCSLRNLVLRFWAKFVKISSAKIISALIYSRKN